MKLYRPLNKLTFARLSNNITFLENHVSSQNGIHSPPFQLHALFGVKILSCKQIFERYFFLFIDVNGSTGIAETIGAVKFHELLDRFFYDLTDAILTHKGKIHKYVGDEIIISWPMDKTDPTSKPEVIDCYFAIRDKIASRQDQYRTHFGFVPTFRGAIHTGTVVTGEMGDIKREIVFLGDTVNTTARMIDAAGELDHELLVSKRALSILDLPVDITIQALGAITLRGRKEAVELSALTREP